MKVDIVLTITYPMDAPEKFLVTTNAKVDTVEELLSSFVRDQMGRGKDERPAVEHDAYIIKLGLSLAEDEWAVEHDCGNKGLMTGIVLDVLARWSHGVHNYRSRIGATPPAWNAK